jgi:putative ABC transport system permease protein
MMLKVTLRNLAAHKLRLLLTALSVVLGVAFVAGTLIFTDTMGKTFDDLFSQQGKGVAVEVRAKRLLAGGNDEAVAPVPASALEALRKVDGVKDPIGSVSGYTVVIGRDGKAVGGNGPPQLGGDWSPTVEWKITSGRAPSGPGEVILDATTADKSGYHVGDQARILLQGGPQTVRVVGVFENGNLLGATVTGFDLATAQQLLLKPGYFTDITMGAQSGVSETVLRDRVARTLPGNLEAVTGTKIREESKSSVAQIMSFLRTFLLVFAAISLFVGAFIIFNTFSMLVAQRTKELALLRAVGASRKQVTRAVLGEAIVLGLIGSTLGLAAGAGLAMLLAQLFKAIGLDLNAGLVFTVKPVIWSYVVGVLVTVVAAYFPARRAAKIPPVAAMRDDVALPQRSLRIRLIVGVAFTAIGIALMGTGLTGSGLALLGAGVALVFLGVAMLAPIISGPVVRVLGAALPRLFGTPGRLAVQNAQRNPRRTAATAAALMIGLALVSGINVLSASAKASISKSIDAQLGADYLISGGNGAGFSGQAATNLRAVPGVKQVTPIYGAQLKLNGKEHGVVAADPVGLAAAMRITLSSGSLDLGRDGLLISQDVATSNKWSLGSTVQVQYHDLSTQRLRVAGVYPKSEVGGYIMSLPAYREHGESQLVRQVFVVSDKAGASTKAALERSLTDYPILKVQDRSDVKKENQKTLDQFVLMLTALLGLSIIIAALGVINTLALSVVERTREIGLLRAIGTSRRQLRRMIRLESTVIAVFGALLGLGLGVLFGWSIQWSLRGEGLDVLVIPAGTLVIYLVLSGVIGVVAALWPAWRAGRMDVLRAIGSH